MVTHPPSSVPRVFVAHCPDDEAFAHWLSGALRELGHTVWVGSENITGGLHTMEAIQSALDHSDVMVLLVTPKALQSRMVNSQWTYFYYERQKPLIPVLSRSLGPDDRLNFMLASLQSITFARADGTDGESEAALANLHRALTEAYGNLGHNGDDVPPSYRMPPVPVADVAALNGGVVQVHPGMPVEAFVEWARQATQHVRMLTTWTGLLASRPDVFHEALKHGCFVQILLLNPASPFARQRSLDMHLGTPTRFVDEYEVPRNIQTMIRQLGELHLEVAHLPGRLELRLYDLLPSFSWFQCDSRALVGFFPHTSRMTAFPMLEIQPDSTVGQRFGQDFDAVWSHATAVDLVPRGAVHSMDMSLPLTDPVSAREIEVLEMIVAGWSNQEIADQLVVALSTVKKHIHNTYSKLGVQSRTQAILRAHQLQLVPPASPPSPR